MTKPRNTYVHRGDAIRRRNRLRRLIAFIGVAGAAMLVIANRRPSTPVAEAAAIPGASTSFSFGLVSENRRLRQELENAMGEASLLRAQVERANVVISFSERYGIPANLAELIFDVAIAERVDPELAFRMVKLESNFNTRATSKVGAVGLAQVMPATAVHYQRGITKEKLYDPRTNLTIGLRHMRRLIHLYDGDIRMALLAYNLGEQRVSQARKAGKNPFDGYNRILIKAYNGSGISD